jgi:hypothetical protein
MPSVYRPKHEKVFRSKIGYHLDPSGKRVRQEFRLGDDKLMAYKMVLSLGEKWLRERQRHKKLLIEFKEMFPSDPLPLLIWTGTPEVETNGREEYLATPPDDLPGDEIDSLPIALIPIPIISIEQVSQDLLVRLRAKARRDAKSFRTFRWYEEQFRLGLVPPAINPLMSVTAIMMTHVEQFCDYWCDLVKRASETKRKSFKWRTAINRLDAFGFLLRDLKGRVKGFVYPERADAVIEEAKKTVAGALTAIQTYDPMRLRAIFKKGDDRLRLMMYLAMNFGMYQSDIGQQLRRQHTNDDGGVIEIDGETYVQWHRHKLKRRQRMLMREDDQEKPVLLTHYIWPETLRLLNEFRSPQDNALNLWLLNERGMPLWRQEEHHKRPVDNISTAYHRAVKDAGVCQPFGQIRKFGATACESISSIEVQEMYRGERRKGSSRVYVLKDFVGKLTPFLKTWAERLRTDGVLY